MLPYLTADQPGIGGSIKNRNEDFFVQEMPLYEPSGEGEHVYCEVQKVGIPTFEAIDRLAQALNISPRDIGYAGLKDARAVSQQVFSIWGVTEEAVMALRLPGLTVQWARRHGNKLRLGHLSGNRFAIRIREVNPTDVIRVRAILQTIERRGIPNYFGEQRFGRRGDNDRLGAAYVRGDDKDLLHHLLGNPLPELDDRQTLLSRQAFDRGELDVAMKHWPRRSGMERRVLHRFIKTRKAGAAVRAVDEKLRRLWVSALQSRVFNEVLAQRVQQIDHVMDGDLAYKHDNGACFLIGPGGAGEEQARCDAFEISPTGPLVGYRMTLPAEEPLRIEQERFAAAKLDPSDFRRTHVLKVKGARRPLRVKPNDVQVEGGVDDHGAHVTVAFTLPAGSFATVLLRELMKDDVEAAPAEDADASDPSVEETVSGAAAAEHEEPRTK